MILRTLVLLALVGCARRAAPHAAASPSDDLARQLGRIARQEAGDPDRCAVIDAPDLGARLVALAETHPDARVAMTAAACTVARAGDDQLAAMRRWVSDPATPGLAHIVIDHRRLLPDDVQAMLLPAIAAGPHAARLEADTTP